MRYEDQIKRQEEILAMHKMKLHDEADHTLQAEYNEDIQDEMADRKDECR